ncbi:MAG: hypothetical protein IEMM0002_1220 [bacterium]|nr:MAG: hypothetical protein IEMM0002_1220 [bacterium]
MRVCPECHKAFFQPVGRECCPPCPHCGHVLVNQRGQERLITKTDFTLSVGGRKRSATIVDFSADGARIVYDGKEIPDNGNVKLNVDKLNIHRRAKAVWTRKLGDEVSQTGLMLL